MKLVPRYRKHRRREVSNEEQSMRAAKRKKQSLLMPVVFLQLATLNFANSSYRNLDDNVSNRYVRLKFAV